MSATAHLATLRPEGILTTTARGGLASPALRWAIAPALAAWLLLLCLPGNDLALCVAPRATPIDGALAGIAATFATFDPQRFAAEWALMIVAMMFPLLVPMIAFVAARNFAARRERSVSLFVAGFAAVWIAAGVLAGAGLLAVRAGLG